MDENEERKLIEAFAMDDKRIVPLYGGDGTLVSEYRKYKDKCFLPIRNYGRCTEHADINSILKGKPLRQQQHWKIEMNGDTAISEVQVRNTDITSAIRFDITVNGKPYAANVIADGIIVSTALGSSGYFHSITNTIFRDGIGLAFLNPTHAIPHLVLSRVDTVGIKFIRSGTVKLAWDKIVSDETDVNDGDEYFVRSIPECIVTYGRDIFMCNECRRNRNSTILLNEEFGI